MKKYINQIIKLISSKTARHTYFVSTGNIFVMFCAFIFTVILVRIMSMSDFGYYSALLSLLLLASELADFGIGNSLSRFLPPLKNSQKQLESMLKASFILQFGIALFFSSIILLSANLLANIIFHKDYLFFLIQITSLGIFCAILSNYTVYVLNARQQFIRAALITSLSGIIRVSSLLLLILLSKVNLVNVVWMQTFNFVILLFIGFYFIGIKFILAKLEIDNLKKIMHFTSFMGTARGLTAITGRLDVLMLITFLGSVEAGVYAIASRVVSIYPLLSSSFTSVIAPKIASIKDKKELEKFLLKVIIATGFLISTILFFILFAYPFIVLLFGLKSIPAISVFRMLLFGMIFFVSSVPAVALAVYYLKKPQILTINSILQLLIVIVGNIILIPVIHIIGPAVALTLAYFASFVLTSYLSYYYLTKERTNDRYSKTLQ